VILSEAHEVPVAPVVGAHVTDMSQIELVAADESDNESGAHIGALWILARMLVHGAVGFGEGVVEQRNWVMFRTLHLWEVATGNCLRTFDGHTHKVTSAAACSWAGFPAFRRLTSWSWAVASQAATRP
jgi:hypothetical protein